MVAFSNTLPETVYKSIYFKTQRSKIYGMLELALTSLSRFVIGKYKHSCNKKPGRSLLCV